MKLKLGNICITSGINKLIHEGAITNELLFKTISRHENCDFGDLCEDDKKLNEDAVKNEDDRILSSYNLNDNKVWIITEWDGSLTTVLLPDEY